MNYCSKAITIKDIAKALNFSHSTVARALKGSYCISEETIQKVKKYAEAHNYRPNLFAQSLKNKQSRSIGVMMPTVSNDFFAEVINGIEAMAAEKNYHIIISQTMESYQNELTNLEHLLWRSVDGIMVSLSAETESLAHFENLKEKVVPIVFFDRVPENILTHKVIADNVKGSYDLTRHLIDSGFSKIAHITSSPQLSITRERLEGYHNALQESNIPLNDDYVKFCPHGGKDEVEINCVLDQLLSLPNPPDAIITASDRLTIKSFSLLKLRGIQIPEQVALAGFSNFNAPELFNPSLTTIVQPVNEMGRNATELLIQLIESKRATKEFKKIVLPTQLVIRQSTQKGK